MMGNKLQDRVRNIDIRKSTKVKDVVGPIAQLKWRWTSRITNWSPRADKRRRGRPPTRSSIEMAQHWNGGAYEKSMFRSGREK